MLVNVSLLVYRMTDPTPPSKRRIVHGHSVADPLEAWWENGLLTLLAKDSALQAVTRIAGAVAAAQVVAGLTGSLTIG